MAEQDKLISFVAILKKVEERYPQVLLQSVSNDFHSVQLLAQTT